MKTKTVAYVKVPVTELRKLEAARAALFELVPEQFHRKLITITGQIWLVANTKIWKNTSEAPDSDGYWN